MIKIILYSIAAYLFLVLYAFLMSNRMIFLPPRPAGYKDSDDIIKLKTKDGATIAAVYYPNANAQYILLFSHGNAIDIGYLKPLLEDFQKQGFAVFAYDYHGYGISTGRPSESHAYADVYAAYDYITQELGFLPNRIIAFGRSLGAAMAIELAAHKPIAGIIVQSPFITAYRVVTYLPILPFDKFNNLKKIKHIPCPKLFIHSEKDDVIPFWHGRMLYRNASEPKQYLWPTTGRHNDPIWDMDKRYWPTIQQFAKRLGEDYAI